MTVKTAARVLDLFEHFAETQQPLTLSELASALSIPVSSCFALINTLRERGYLYSLRGQKNLYPTRRLLDVARRSAEHDPVLQSIRPVLARLGETTRETIVLSGRYGDEITYLDICESPNSVRYHAEVGETRPLYRSSAGKAFLGAMSDQELQSALARFRFERVTAATLTSAKALRADLETSRQRGWFYNAGESVEDLGGVAVTIELAGERYGLSVVGPLYRIEQHLEKCARALLKAQRQLQRET